MTSIKALAVALTAIILGSSLCQAAPETETPTLSVSATVAPAITGAKFDWSSVRTLAPGSDNWPATWSNDDNQYAMWGDGGGFGGTDTDGRSSLGVARIVGDNTNYQGFNRYGGKGGECPAKISGKGHGAPFSLGGILYVWISPGSGPSGYDSFSLYKSVDKACNWTPVGVTFARNTDGISFGSFVQTGKDNASAIDAYVYSVATAVVSDTSSLELVQRPGRIILLRVPALSIEKKSAYEFFAGLDATGQPLWSIDATKASAVYQDADGVGPFPQMSYVPDLKLFVYTNQHGNGSDNAGARSRLTMAQAARPWGPWSEFYRDVFFPSQSTHTLFQWNFAPKWFRSGGLGFTLIFSGTQASDSWSTVDGTFATSAVNVDLSAVGNVYALMNEGTPVPSGGIDGWGNAYSRTLTGASILWSGATFNFGASGTANGVRARTVPLTPGNYSGILLLATAVNGKQADQKFTVAYTDGSTATLSPQSLSDWYAPLAQKYIGESIVSTYPRRVTANGTTQSKAVNLYGYRLSIDTSKVLQSITLPNNRNVVVLAMDLIPTPAPTPTIGVSLSSVANVYALVNDGTAVRGGGIDNWGNAYSESLTGTSINWSGAKFSLGPSGTLNGVSNTIVPLPNGRFRNVLLLATGVNGKQANQVFTVRYTDGTSSSPATQSLSDWYAPLAQHYAGESIVSSYAHRVRANGAIQSGPFNLYGYKLAIDSSKTVQSITLPKNRNVVVVAIDLTSL